MKRSEANQILKARMSFSSAYDCTSPVNDCYYDWHECPNPDDCQCEIADPHFDHNGCDICGAFESGGACNVYDCQSFLRTSLQNKTGEDRFEIHEHQLCGNCMSALVNGDDSDLDYYVDNEDCEAI